MTTEIQTTVIKFSNILRNEDLPLLRGAVISSLVQDNILFHNHDGALLRYSYPLIQYKIIGKNPAIYCIGEGNDAIIGYMSNFSSDIILGDRHVRLCLESVRKENWPIGISDSQARYRIKRWLPLNQKNYRIYTNTESAADKCRMLEKILIGNILSMGKGIGISFKEKIYCTISDITERYTVTYKGVRLMAFDIDFVSNAVLPPYIGMGKGVSIGYGCVCPFGSDLCDR